MIAATAEWPGAIRATIDFLRVRIEARATGYPVYLTTDPTWLIHMAINRRAGWVEDPHFRGAMEPVNGRLPRFGTGNAQRLIRQLSERVNTPRLRVYETELGEWGRYLIARLPGRFVRRGEE